MFSEKDLNQIAAKGLTESVVTEQISRFKQGYPSLKIIKAATVKHGILALKDDELSELVDYYEEDSNRPGVTDIFLRKNRNGPTGRVELMFKKEQMRFYDIEKKKSATPSATPSPEMETAALLDDF